jgi:hypothetical protein
VAQTIGRCGPKLFFTFPGAQGHSRTFLFDFLLFFRDESKSLVCGSVVSNRLFTSFASAVGDPVILFEFAVMLLMVF